MFKKFYKLSKLLVGFKQGINEKIKNKQKAKIASD